MNIRTKRNKLNTLYICTLLTTALIFNSCGDKHIAGITELDIQAGEPIYTSYAASKENSGFIIDQGYDFIYDHNDTPLCFRSSKGGSLGLGFICNNKYISAPGEMFAAPVINYSFPDMVSFSFSPVKNINCKGIFTVSSSSSFISEFLVSNDSDTAVSFALVPYLESSERLFTSVSSEDNSFFFTSEKYPDSWTLSHKLPHVDTLVNIFSVSTQQTDKSICTSINNVAPTLPYSVNQNRNTADLIISGRGYTKSGERITLAWPDFRPSLISNDRKYIITGSCPLPGTSDNPVSDGYFRLNAGNFPADNDRQSLLLECYMPAEKLAGRSDTSFTKGITPSSFRQNITLSKMQGPQPVENLNIIPGGNSSKLQWSTENKQLQYDIYRRSDDQKYFSRIADRLKTTSFMDINTDMSVPVRYLIVSYDPANGLYSPPSREVSTLPVTSFESFISNKESNSEYTPMARRLCFKETISLPPGESVKIRVIRKTAKSGTSNDILKKDAYKLMKTSLSGYYKNNIRMYKDLQQILTSNRQNNLLVLSAFNMMNQVMYPPEGKSSYNYYVFSREPVWGWGHGGQVFHESITMLAYAILFPEEAMNSQRVYSERQYKNGYINYRTGSYLDEIIEHNGELTSSAPWYSWLNWEIYRITGDRDFLEEMYDSSKKFYNFFISTRDKDGDGLCEWGGHAILESVRDALVAVWDEVGWPSEFEGVDINSMLVNEARSLEKMALELNLPDEAAAWEDDYTKRSSLVNEICWDDKTGFYFNADKKDNDFSYKNRNDLKREEIIGFLPLWAGIANEQQAARLVENLCDTNKFWRSFGVPSLSASDPYYNDKGYWNGPVWVEWNYLVMKGLIDYGYNKEARQLVEKVVEVMTRQLAEDHTLWEFYSPDQYWGGYHKTYIWAGIITRMMIDTGIIDYNINYAGE